MTLGGAEEAGLSPNIDLAFPITAGSANPVQSLSTRQDLDQPTVEEMLKEEIRQSAGWSWASGILFGTELPTDQPYTDGLLERIVAEGLQIILGLLFGTIPVSSGALFGSVNPTQYAVLPADAVTASGSNVLVVNHFYAGSFEEQGNWSVDETVGHTAVGSAKVVGDTVPVPDHLVSSQLSVTPFQKISAGAWARWRDIAYTGTDPIVLGVNYYTRNLFTGVMEFHSTEDLASFTLPDEDSSNGGHNDFLALTVDDHPIPIGVEEVRLRLTISAGLTAGTVWWDDIFLTNRSSLVNTVTNRLWGYQANTGWSIDDFDNAVLTQNNSVIQNSSDITALWAALSAGSGGSGIAALDQFNRDGADLGADWDVSPYGIGFGGWTTDGSAAAWVEQWPNGELDTLCRWIGAGAASNTAYQTISVVLSSKAEDDGIYTGTNDVIGRADTDAAPNAGNYIRGRCWGNGDWELSKCVNGTLTTMASGNTTAAGSSSTLTLTCGDKPTSTLRHFTLKIDATVLASGTFGDATSNYGAGYDHWGMGGRAEGFLFFPNQSKPGKVNTWAAWDT